MIIYFADRQFNILGQASTGLPAGLLVSDDRKIEEIETGVAVFECKIHFDADTRAKVEACTEVGNFVLRSHDNENEFYTIIDCDIDSKDQTAYIYAEDAGLDLLNEIVGEYVADKAYPITHYVEKFAYDSGFKIGVNEAASLTMQLSWDNEETVTARLASVAAQFDGCEISYSYDVKGLKVTDKYINIHRKRGKDIGTEMRLNNDIDNIVISKTITNLATALRCTGGTIDQDSTILEAQSSASPQVAYKVQLETKGRTASTVEIRAKVTAGLTTESASLDDGYGLTGSIYMGGGWHSVTLKATDKDNKRAWSGTTEHSVEYTFTISGVSAAAITYSDIQFKVTRSDSKGGSAGVLAATKCNSFMIPNYIEGGENGEDIESRAITLEGYKYDDGDFYIDGDTLKSRNALKKWSRYLYKDEPNQTTGQQGHIVKLFSDETFIQSELCAKAIKELKSICDKEVNYEAEIKRLPPNTKIGDRLNIVDEAGKLYLSTRLLQLKVSVADQTQEAVLGEHLIKRSGINQKVLELAEKFAKNAQSAARALAIAKDAKNAASTAQAQANSALNDASVAKNAADSAQTAADAANQSAQDAQTAANNAQAAVDSVEEQVTGLETTVANAQAAAEQAQQAASTAETKATEAQQAAVIAQEKAEQVEEALADTTEKAETAISNAQTAQSTADQAKQEAEAAATTAAAAKLDAEQAQKDIDSLGESLTTLSNTMSADYARKTDLTETEASLQTQITQNAAQISSTASSVQIINETANNAKEQAEAAQASASAAQAQADQASADAQAAQNAADQAAAAASAAQSQADTAKAAAATAQGVADKAEADLEAAKADLATVTGRVDATEADILAAQQAVTAAQTAADKANADAEAAAKKAADAQETADTAVTNASAAQQAANEATNKATVAQATANEAKGNAEAAQATADEAKANALEAQQTANTAVANAQTAQTKADEAAQAAASAQSAADDADAKADQAAADLATAQQNLASVTSRVDATEEEVAAAQAAVVTAQAAADKAKEDAAAAQSTADTAKANAATAQQAADDAKTAADNAQREAEEAQAAADAAQADVNALAVRVTSAETRIDQNDEEIALRAKKTEVAETLGGYYTKEEADAAIELSADSVKSTVSQTYTTKGETSQLETRVSSVEQDAYGLSVQLDILGEQSVINANNAAKTATNFLSYDSEGGLQVGNKQNGDWEGYRTQIKPDSFNILAQDGTALAKYGANSIELGSNSEETAISLCKGKGYIRSQDGYFTINGDEFTLLRASQSDYMGHDCITDLWLNTDMSSHDMTYAWLRARVNDETTGESGVEGGIFVRASGVIDVLATGGADSHVRFYTPLITTGGDLNVAGDIYDNQNTVVRNGLAAYGGSSNQIDPNTTNEHLILTQHSNCPTSAFYFIHTLFYYSKADSDNKMQLALPYNSSSGGVYYRYKSGGIWSDWIKLCEQSHNHNYITTASYYRFNNGWIGLYPSAGDAANATNRKGWIGYDNGDVLTIHDDRSGIDLASWGNIRIYAAGSTLRVAFLADRMRPGLNDSLYLGDSTYKWKAVYAVNGSIQTSDRNLKDNIQPIDQKYIDLFDKLQPVTFEFADKESDRTHIGFISQDVKAAMDEVGLSDLDFAGYCRDAKIEYDEEANKDVAVLDEEGNPAYLYSLRYSEFIALNSKMIQLNRAQIAKQAQEIDSLKAELAELRQMIKDLKADGKE